MGSEHTPAKPDRLLSIDALRGFDMFWIIGGDALFRAFGRWNHQRWSTELHDQLEHVEWSGFHFYDLIFPLFLFVVGVVLPFSLDKQREQGGTVYGRVLRRTIFLFALGLLCNNLLQFDWANLRVAGVLQRIALCYFFAALIFLNFSVRGQVIVTAVILLGYWALLALVAAPGFMAGDYTMEGNLPGFIDRLLLPGKIYKEYYGYGDNEGLLSTLPAIATAMLGVLAGHWLRSAHAPWWKVGGLAVAGVLCLAAGYTWSFTFPIIKNIWTSSFVLFAGGWSLLLLALFYAIIDVLRWRSWAFFFIVIGANAITIYVVPRFVDFRKASDFFFGGLVKQTGSFTPVAAVAAVLLVKWLFLLFLYRKRVFLRV
jgi:predicted acyltransferase